ncbi:MAG: DUF4445 domain-containing protein, partial [Clostridia bacterium]|nr:DUF4445 domain-containing protein [Clostridia bacterium]
LAKSAVRSAVECLILRAGIGYEDIETMYVAGGFSAELNFENAAFIGLFPQQLIDRVVCVNNSSLLGTVKYACDGIDLKEITSSAEYIDLGADGAFSNLFFENMAF